MSNNATTPVDGSLRHVAASTTVVVAMMAAAGFAYLLLDIILLFFIGIVVATALRPWHDRLCAYGIPRGVAVLLIYLLLLLGLGLLGLLIGPVLIEQTGTFTNELPATYESARTWLRESAAGPLQLIGQRLPPFSVVTQSLADAAPQWFQGALGVTAALIALPTYFVSVLAVAFYWTMEVPRVERLAMSLIPVEQRPRILNIWHDIESRLGGFMRGQGLAMLAIGAMSALGYWLIGLPNVLALALLAGMLEAVPMIGPILGTIPAALVALSLGPEAALMVVGFAVVLQTVENNFLIPRIMDEAVGVSALVGLFAVLAFGTLYGLVGILIAIPIAAVIQVLLDTLVINAEPVAAPESVTEAPWPEILARVGHLRQQARGRIRTRSSRMGIDPETADHVVDAVDQQIEGAATRVENLISIASGTDHPLAAESLVAIVDKLQESTDDIRQAVDRVETAACEDESAADADNGARIQVSKGTEEAPSGQGSRSPVDTSGEAGEQQERDASGDDVEQAGQRFQVAVHDIEAMVAAAQKQSKEDRAAVDARGPTESASRPRDE